MPKTNQSTGAGGDKYSGYKFKFPAMRSAELAHGMNSLSGDSSLPGGMLGVGHFMDSGVSGRNAKGSKLPALKARKIDGGIKVSRPRNGGSTRGGGGRGATQ